MKIVVFSPTSTPLTLDPMQPIGGADSSLLHLISAFPQHKVIAYIPLFNRLERFGKVVYVKVKGEIKKGNLTIKHFEELAQERQKCDIYIHYRNANWPILNRIKAKTKVFYSQDDTDAGCFNNLAPNFFDQFDKIICLSFYHKKRFIDNFSLSFNPI
jgi:hypothetical protein